MAFWILVAALVAAVTLAITRPLMRSDAPWSGDVVEPDVEVYKDQLKEIDADEVRGALPAAEADGARAEIARRLLRVTSPGRSAAADEGTAKSNATLASRVYLATSLVVPVLSLALYLSFGAPGMPGQPLSDRLVESVDKASPMDLVAKVEARLRDRPDDGTGWDVVAPVYYAMQRYGDAAQAYANAIRLLGEDVRRLQGFANSRIRSENGVVPEDARKALERILEINPTFREPKVWLALAKEQDGKLDEAVADYKALLSSLPAEAPLRQVLLARLEKLQPGAAVPPPAPSTSAPKISEGPAPPDASAVLTMKPEERQTFINNMVSGLAERLKTNPADAAGWLKLIRAYDVLGRSDEARKALDEARVGLKNDNAGLARVEDLARELKIGG